MTDKMLQRCAGEANVEVQVHLASIEAAARRIVGIPNGVEGHIITAGIEYHTVSPGFRFRHQFAKDGLYLLHRDGARLLQAWTRCFSVPVTKPLLASSRSRLLVAV